MVLTHVYNNTFATLFIDNQAGIIKIFMTKLTGFRILLVAKQGNVYRLTRAINN